MRLEGWHWAIIIILAILLFGAPKLPGLARSVGQSLRIFKSEVKQLKDDNGTAEASAEPPVEGRVVNPSPVPGQAVPGQAAHPVQDPHQPGSDVPPPTRQ